MPEKKLSYAEQRLFMRKLLENITEEFLKSFTPFIKAIYEGAKKEGIDPEIVTAELNAFKENFPGLKIEVALDSLPPKEERH